MNDTDHLFEGFARPVPPKDLRERTIRQASAAMISPVRRNVWKGLWESVSLRLVWSTAVVVLVAAHVVISTGEHPVRRRSANAESLVAAGGGNELSEIVDLPRIKKLRPGLMGFGEAGVRLGEKPTKGDVS